MHLEIDNNSTVSNFTKNNLLDMLKDYVFGYLLLGIAKNKKKNN